MALSVNSTHLPALAEPHQREEVGNQLQGLLVELIDLSLLGKQLHWTVVGPLFRPLHLHLDEMVDEWRELSDTVAERAVAIGFIPDGQNATIASESPVRGVARGELDSASQDVVVEVVRALEEQLWMIRAQLSERETR